jgi:glycosyltransferase involved in cell wall biosynthesis
MNPADPTISVIIPLYNGERFITQALDSVFSQTRSPTEIIVVDDGSTDAGSELVARHAGGRRLVLLQQTNRGQSSARNLGIGHSKGKLIALLDQDDIWYPNHLKNLLLPFTEDTSELLGWTYSNLDEITVDGHLRLRGALSGRRGEHPKMDLHKCLRNDMFVLPSAAMISRAAFDAVGGFDEELSGYEDDDLFVRLFAAGYNNVYLEEALGQKRIHAASLRHSPCMARSRMLYARKLLRCFPDEPELAEYWSRDLIVPRFLPQVVEEARRALRIGDSATIDARLEDISILERHISSDDKSCLVRRHFLITAIIPLYNGGQYIREAVQSVLDQGLPADEIIVVDDGSTDDGPDIVAEMARQHPIRIFRKENGGQSSARNLGVDHAHGDLIAFLDQDDAWYPNHLAELVKPFLRKGAVELGWSYSNLDETNEAGEMIGRGLLNPIKSAHPKRDLVTCLSQDMFVLPSASLISRRAFRRVGGFDERLSGYEDDDLFLRMFLAGFGNVYIPASLSKWRIYQASSSYSQRMAVSRAIYARKLIDRFPNDRDKSRYYVRDMIAPRFFRTMATELRKAFLKGTTDQQKTALTNLGNISSHLRLSLRVPIRLFLLPALRIRPVARLLMEHWSTLAGVWRRLR